MPQWRLISTHHALDSQPSLHLLLTWKLVELSELFSLDHTTSHTAIYIYINIMDAPGSHPELIVNQGTFSPSLTTLIALPGSGNALSVWVIKKASSASPSSSLCGIGERFAKQWRAHSCSREVTSTPPWPDRWQPSTNSSTVSRLVNLPGLSRLSELAGLYKDKEWDVRIHIHTDHLSGSDVMTRQKRVKSSSSVWPPCLSTRAVLLATLIPPPVRLLPSAGPRALGGVRPIWNMSSAVSRLGSRLWLIYLTNWDTNRSMVMPFSGRLDTLWRKWAPAHVANALVPGYQ